MYILTFLLFFSPVAFSQDLSQVLNLLQAEKVQSELSPEQCSSLENENITFDVESCLYTLCGSPEDGEIQKARKRLAEFSHPEADKYFNEVISPLEKRVLEDQQLLETALQNIKIRGSELLPENASAEDQGLILSRYFERFTSVAPDGRKVIYDPYSELTGNQKQIIQQLANSTLSRSIACQGSLCRQAFMEIPEVIQYKKLVTSGDKLLILPKEQLLSQCRLAFQAEAAEVHHKSNNKEFLRRLENVRDNFLVRLKEKFDDDSISSFKTYLEKTGITLNANDEESFYDSVAKRISTPYQAVSGQGFYQSFNTLMNFKVGDQLSPQAPAMFACDGEYLKPGGSAGNGVYLLQFSTFAPGLGEQVYLHELGHMLSYFFKDNETSITAKKTYLEQRKCVAGYHSDNEAHKNFGHFEGDTTRTEEEMGDFYQASTVSSELPPLNCMNFDYDLITFRYKNPLEKKPPHDEYSSNIERLILEMSMRKKSLPSSCQKVAKKLRLNLERSCF